MQSVNEQETPFTIEGLEYGSPGTSQKAREPLDAHNTRIVDAFASDSAQYGRGTWYDKGIGNRVYFVSATMPAQGPAAEQRFAERYQMNVSVRKARHLSENGKVRTVMTHKAKTPTRRHNSA